VKGAARLALCIIAGAAAIAALGQVATTKHNLSVSGPGGVKAASETQICIFCHTPHNSSPAAPLWNRADPGGNAYTPYTSSTTKSLPGQPNGASLLCLSCHDGTIALGNVLSRTVPITMAGTSFMPPSSPSYIGTDLSDDHPVSIAYNDALVAARGELASPASLVGGRVKLDVNGYLQCTSCHDPHANPYGKFLVMANQAGALCIACHVKSDWAQASHATSAATWNGSPPTPWPHTSGTTVAANACENCHRPHTAGGPSFLLNYGVNSGGTEEDNCYTCHNGNVATKNVQGEFVKYSHHPVEMSSGTHDPTESAIVQDRHVECVDCHNPHASNATSGSVPGSLKSVSGVDMNGAPVAPVSFEYQICFRCHGDSYGQPPPGTTRLIAEVDLRLQMTPGNPSYHPVLATGVNTNVPSLIPPLTSASVIKCTDCHNNDAGPNGGGTGPRGPHGSGYRKLLERQYIPLDRTTESASAYALCYKCHDRTSIISTGTHPFGGTQGHYLHVVTERASCNVCHDPHGVSLTQGGNPTNNSKLINFDITVVHPVTGVANTPRFESLALNRGRCYLVCHGQTHNPFSYPNN
jgi:predicted CXXCH cytochrome family protein